MGKRRSGEGEQGEGTNTSGVRIRGAPELLSLILNQRGVGLHDSVVRTGKTGEAKQDEEECNIWDASDFV